MKNPGREPRSKRMLVAAVLASSLALLGCGGGGDETDSTVSLAAADEEAAAGSGSDSEAATNEDETPASTSDDDAAAADDIEDESDTSAGDQDSTDDAAVDDGDDNAETTNDKKKTPAAPTDVDTELTVDPDLPDEIVVVTAPPSTTPPAPAADGVVFERIDPSPELPGMTKRPIRDAFADPSNNSLLVVRFGALLCDGFRTVVNETPDAVSVSLEGVNTLNPGADCDDTQLYATELAAGLASPIGDRAIEIIEP